MSSFSWTWPETLVAPGSRPPWPASITTIGRPLRIRRGVNAVVGRRRQVDGQACLGGRAAAAADQRDGNRGGRNGTVTAAPGNRATASRACYVIANQVIEPKRLYHANLVNANLPNMR